MAETDLLVRIRAVLEADAGTAGGTLAKQLQKDIREVFATLRAEAAKATTPLAAEGAFRQGREVGAQAISTAQTLQGQGKISQKQFDRIFTTLGDQLKGFDRALQGAIPTFTKSLAGTTGPMFTRASEIQKQNARAEERARKAGGIVLSGGDDPDAPELTYTQQLAAQAAATANALAELAAGAVVVEGAEILYAEALAVATASQAQIDAQQAQLLAYMPGYAESLAAATASNARIKATTDQILAVTPGYARSLADSAVAQAQIKAQTQQILSTSAAYVTALADTAVSQAQIDAGVKAQLAANTAYVQALANSATSQAQITASTKALLAQNPAYIRALADATASQARITAQQQALLVSYPGYAGSLAQATTAQAQINAQQQAILSQNVTYLTSLTNSAVSQAQIAASQKAQLATSATYIDALASSAISQASITAQQKAILAGSTRYVGSLAAAASSQAEIDAAQKGILAGSTSYINAITNSAISQASINAQQKQQLAASGVYIGALARSAAAQSSISAQQAELLSTNSAYIGTQVRITAARAQLAASEQESLALNVNYAGALARSAAAKAATAATEQEILAQSTLYAGSLARSATAKAQIAAAEARMLSTSQAYIDAQAEHTVAKRVLAGEEANVILGNQAYVQALGEATAAKKMLAAAEEQVALSILDDPLHQARVAGNRAQSRLSAAQVEASTLTDPRYQSALEIEAANKVTAAAAKARAAATVEAATNEQAGADLAARKLNTERQNILANVELLGATQAELAAKAQSVNNQKDINILQAERKGLEAQVAAKTAALMPANPNQPPGPGGPKGGIDFLGGARSTIKYGLPSMLLFGAFRGVTQAVKEAAELERIFNQIERQFESFGTEEIFPDFRNEILSIARETGSAASEVANVGFQLQGAFGGDTVLALSETRSAMEAVRVTGLEIREVIDAFTALTQNFRDSGLSISDVTDKALGLQERFGVLAKETISFSADLAPVAAAANIGADELQALGAVAQKYSGRTGTSLAEAFGRIIPQIQGNAAKFLQFFESIPALAGNAAQLASSFQGGDILNVIQLLGQGYGQLSDAQQNYVADLLGGRREAQAIIGVLEHHAELQRELNGEYNDSGKATEYFGDLQETLQQKLKRVGEEMSQLGVRIYEAGLRDFLSDLLSLGETLVDVLTMVMDLISSIAGIGGGSIGSILGTIAEGIILFKGAGMLTRGVGRLRGGAAAAGGAHMAGQAAQTGLIAGATGAFKGRIAAVSAARAANAAAAGTAALNVGRGAAAFGGALTAASAAIPWTAAAAVIGIGIDQFSQGIRKKADEAAAAITGKDGRSDDAEIRTHLAHLDTDDGGGFDRAEFDRLRERILADGGTLADVQDAMNDVIRSNASGWAHFADALPGDLSSSIKEDKSSIEAIMTEYKTRQAEILSAATGNVDAIAELSNILAGSSGRFAGLVDGDAGAEEQLAQAKDAVAAAIARYGEGKATGDDEALVALVAQLGPLVEAAAQERIAEAERLDFLTSGEADDLYQAGLISYNKYKTTLEGELRRLRSTNTGTPEENEDIANLQRLVAKAVSDKAIAAVESVNSLEELGGTFNPAAGVNRFASLLQGGDLDRAGRKKVTESLLGMLNDLHDYQVEQADSIEEQIALYESGVKIPEVARIEILADSLLTVNTEFGAMVDRVFGGFTEDASAFSRAVATLQIQTGKDLNSLAVDVLTLRKAILQQQARAEQVALNFISGLGGIFSFLDFGADDYTSPLQAEIDRIDSEITNLENVDLGAAPGVPTRTGADPKEAAKLREQAAEEAKRKAEEARRAAKELAEANLDYMLALVENDPAKAAQIAQQRADVALRFASTEAERLSAMAERVRADRSVREALYSIANSQIDLLIAYANAAGDTVEAANLSLDLERQKLAQMQAEGAGIEAINNQLGVVATAEASARDAFLGDKLDYYNYLHEMGKITTQQLIAYLTELLKIPDLTEKQVQDIQLQIKGLRDQLGQDFQFNLPSNLDLPTLYEVRRLNQTGAAGTGYGAQGVAGSSVQNVTINFTATNDVDAQNVVDTIVQQFSKPPRFGTTGRPF